MQKAILMPYTIWKFRGVTVPGESIVARTTEPMDDRYQNEYNTILAYVNAYSPSDAINRYNHS